VLCHAGCDHVTPGDKTLANPNLAAASPHSPPTGDSADVHDPYSSLTSQQPSTALLNAPAPSLSSILYLEAAAANVCPSAMFAKYEMKQHRLERMHEVEAALNDAIAALPNLLSEGDEREAAAAAAHAATKAGAARGKAKVQYSTVPARVPTASMHARAQMLAHAVTSATRCLA
jgi:hypothetical protein